MGGSPSSKPAPVRQANIMFSKRKSLSLGRASIKVYVIKGDLATENNDATVCTASKNLDLKRGRASRALLDVAGDGMQVDCASKYPTGIDFSEVAVVDAGNLPCQKVFFVALPVLGTGHQELKGLKRLITKCLNEANNNKFKSIALPSLGTGLLNYPADQVANITLQSIEEFSNQPQTISLKYVNIVIFHKDSDSYNAFVTAAKSWTSSAGEATGGVKPKVIPIGLRSIVSRQMSNGDGRNSIGNIKIHVVEGEIAKFKDAEIIVNNTDSNLKLRNGGMSEAILEEAGEELQEECDSDYPNGIKIGEIAVTGSYNLGCKEIYHGTLPKWDKNKAATATKPLCRFVCSCLKQAEQDRIKSIAFPTIGTGSLNYPANISAETMFQCFKKHQNTCAQTSLSDIYIVVYTKGDQWKSIKKTFEDELQKALSAEDIDEELEDDESNDVMYKILEQAAKNALDRTMAPPKGTPDWFKHQFKTNPRPPCYWTEFTTKKTLKDWQLDSDDLKPHRVVVDNQTFNTVKFLTENTWQSQHVGKGRDSRGLDNLKYSNIRVTKVERIENCELFEKYALKRQELFRRAGKYGNFDLLESVKQSSGPILTTSAIQQGSVLDLDVHPEINEHYMFHGTQEEVVDTIMKQGLDSRLGGTDAMFGQGVYAAESSTKSDQYADPVSKRSRGEKKMFLIRMCLGQVYVTRTPKPYARAPCKRCYEDKCSCNDNSFFDSVVGDGGWNFREFVVYDRTQVYPEYLITYQRV